MEAMGAKPVVLVIDDEPDIATYVKVLFEDHGYRALSATDGSRGLELARRHLPDAICLDISMPAPSGLKVYRTLRDDPDTAAIPVVMLTGVPRQFREFVRYSRQLRRPEGYMSKPFSPEELLATVDRLVSAVPV
jgi:CheY-like chemotaxis protein